jgi:hypothetical protein
MFRAEGSNSQTQILDQDDVKRIKEISKIK